MNDEIPSAIRATRGSIIREYADGSLAVRIVIAPTDKQDFMKLLPDVDLPIFIARETPDSAKNGLQEQTIQTYGDFAQMLRLHSNWMSNPEVWRHIGTDDEYLDWCRIQKCTHCSKEPHWEMGTLVLNEAAHVRRVANGAGTAIKPPYSAIPLCSGCHREQHQHGESAIGGAERVNKLRLDHVQRWVWERMRTIFEVGSMREVAPATLLVWAQHRDIDRCLPPCYREAA